MPIPSDYTDIIGLLHEATQAGRVKWAEKGGTLVVRMPIFNLEIWGGSDDETGRGFVAIAVKEPQNDKIVDNFYVEEGDSDYEVLRVLWGSARRQARGVPGKLEALRALLQKGGQIGGDGDD